MLSRAAAVIHEGVDEGLPAVVIHGDGLPSPRLHPPADA
jgi:hypothetical protein